MMRSLDFEGKPPSHQSARNECWVGQACRVLPTCVPVMTCQLVCEELRAQSARSVWHDPCATRWRIHQLTSTRSHPPPLLPGARREGAQDVQEPGQRGGPSGDHRPVRSG